MNYEDLQKKSDIATANFNALSVQIKELESQMTANGELQKQIVNYAKTRTVYVEYRKGIPAKIRNLTEDCIACRYCPKFGKPVAETFLNVIVTPNTGD